MRKMTSDFRHNGQHDPLGTILACQTEVIGDCSVVHVSGEVDLATAHILERALASAIAVPYAIVVDCAGMRYIDSTGLQVLLRARERHHQVLALAALAPTLKRIFELAKIDQTIRFYSTLDAALSALCAPLPSGGVTRS